MSTPLIAPRWLPVKDARRCWDLHVGLVVQWIALGFNIDLLATAILDKAMRDVSEPSLIGTTAAREFLRFHRDLVHRLVWHYREGFFDELIAEYKEMAEDRANPQRLE
jgi:hypothetical protein